MPPSQDGSDDRDGSSSPPSKASPDTKHAKYSTFNEFLFGSRSAKQKLKFMLPYFKAEDTRDATNEEIVRNGIFERGTQEVEVIHRIFLRISADCFLSHVESPSCIWVKLHNHITNQLERPVAYDDEELTFDAMRCTKFRYCLAPRSDSVMSRARILNVFRHDSGVTYCYVLYIDYGHTQWVSSKTLLSLPTELYYHPWQAIPVALFPLVRVHEGGEDTFNLWSEEICDLTRKVMQVFPKLRLKVVFGQHTCFNTFKPEHDKIENLMPIIGQFVGFNEEFPDGISISDYIVSKNIDELCIPEEFLEPGDYIFKGNAILWSEQLNTEFEPDYLRDNLQNIPNFYLHLPVRDPNDPTTRFDWTRGRDEDFGYHSVASMDIAYLQKNKFFLDSGEVVLKISSEQRRNPVGFVRVSLVKSQGDNHTKESVLQKHYDHYIEPVTSLDTFSLSMQVFYGNPKNQNPISLMHAKYKLDHKEPIYGIYHCIQSEGQQVPLHLRYRRVKFIKMENMSNDRDDDGHGIEPTYLVTVEFLDFGLRERVISSAQSLLQIHESHCAQPPFLCVMRICFNGGDFWDHTNPDHKEVFLKALRRDRLYTGNIHELSGCKNGKREREDIIHLSNLRVLESGSTEGESFGDIFKARLSEPKELTPPVKKGITVRSWHKLKPWQIRKVPTKF